MLLRAVVLDPRKIADENSHRGCRRNMKSSALINAFCPKAQ
jgi:hypothetical protein